MARKDAQNMQKLFGHFVIEFESEALESEDEEVSLLKRRYAMKLNAVFLGILPAFRQLHLHYEHFLHLSGRTTAGQFKIIPIALPDASCQKTEQLAGE